MPDAATGLWVALAAALAAVLAADLALDLSGRQTMSGRLREWTDGRPDLVAVIGIGVGAAVVGLVWHFWG